MDSFKQGYIIGEEYEIITPLSQGSFGKVFLGRSKSRNINVAIKIEKCEMSHFNSLNKEVEILQVLDGVPQIPKVFWYGQENGVRIMVQNLLGKDLIHYQKKLKKFSYECVSNIAIQLIEILENIHKRNIIHRDLKPENILGASQSDKIYLIDFGIAKNLEQHYKQKEKVSFIGTTRYASIAAHKGNEQNKKDDLESLGYILIFFLNQTLPWQYIEKSDQQRIEKIGLMKQNVTPDELCQGLPKPILKYLKYVRGLSGKAKPNYAQLKDLFKIEGSPNMPFDWNQRPRSNNRMQSNKSIKSAMSQKSCKQLTKSKSQFHKSQNQIQQQNSQKVIQSPNIKKNKVKTFVLADQGDKTNYYHSSDDLQQHSFSESKKDKESVKVGYSISHEPSKFSRYSQHNKSPLGQQYLKERARVSTLDGNFFDLFVMPMQAEQQLQEFENQDLEIKYNLLHYKSIMYNYKNPIQDFKAIHYEFLD